MWKRNEIIGIAVVAILTGCFSPGGSTSAAANTTSTKSVSWLDSLPTGEEILHRPPGCYQVRLTADHDIYFVTRWEREKGVIHKLVESTEEFPGYAGVTCVAAGPECAAFKPFKGSDAVVYAGADCAPPNNN
jgi:hypothetical protein